MGKYTLKGVYKMLQMIFDLVEKILVWADASAEAQQIISEVFDWLLGVMG